MWIEIAEDKGRSRCQRSPPARVVWIEMLLCRWFRAAVLPSPPARVVWIEIILSRLGYIRFTESPPARVVWIEIAYLIASSIIRLVATREGGVD